MRPSQTVTVSLPPDLAREVDRAAREEGRSRSEVFREALRHYLGRHDRWERIFRYGQDAAGQAGVSAGDVDDIVKASRRSRAKKART